MTVSSPPSVRTPRVVPPCQRGQRRDRPARPHGPDLRVARPETLHQRAMLLWADALLGAERGLLSAEERADTIAALLRLQNPDGGIALASLGPWERLDGSPQSLDSDGYGTAFVSYVLLTAGLPPSHPSLVHALAWLRTHQRRSGRWFTRSATREGTHYISHTGTAFAVLALTRACAPR